MINASDITFLCLPDAAAIEAVGLCTNPKVRIIDGQGNDKFTGKAAVLRLFRFLHGVPWSIPMITGLLLVFV